MLGLDVWDGVLLFAAGYVAVTVLVRLMRAHRNKITAELRSQLQAEQLRRKAEEKRRRREEKQPEEAA